MAIDELSEPARRRPLDLLRRPALLALVLAALTASQPAISATFVVNATDDAGDANPGDGVCQSILVGGPCTLRAAVQEANALAGPDTIRIPTLTLALGLVGTDDTAAAGDLDLTDDVRIEGTGLTQISVGPAERVLDVISGTADFSGLEILGAAVRVATDASAMIENLDVSLPLPYQTAIVNHGRLVARSTMIAAYGATRLGLDNFGWAVLDHVDFSEKAIHNAYGAVLSGRSLQILSSNLEHIQAVLPYAPTNAIENYGRMTLSDSLVRGYAPFDLNVGTISNWDQLTLSNVAIGPNLAGTTNPSGSSGSTVCVAGLWNASPDAAAHLTQVTFYRNSLTSFCVGSAADILNGPGTVFLDASLVIDEPTPDIPSCAGRPIVSLGYNTFFGTGCTNNAVGDLDGDVQFESPVVGFPVPTSANAVDNGRPSCAPLDARGFARPTGAGCDRGAVEMGADIACQNGLDDDGDGLVDLADPGCSSATDALEVDLSPGDVLLTSVESSLLFSVDPVSGRREVVAGGGSMLGPTGVVRAGDGSIYVASFGIAGNPWGPLTHVDPNTGEQTLISWGDAASLSSMTGMTLLPGGTLAVTSPGLLQSSAARIVEVDPATGALAPLATEPFGFLPNGISLDPETGRLFATSPSGSDRLFEIVGGVAVPVTPASTGVGTPRDIEVAGEVAYISDSGATDQLLEVDLVTRVVTPITTLKTAPRGVEIEADGSVLVADRTANEIVRVDPDTGMQDIFSSGSQIDDAYYMDIVAGPEPCEWTRYASQSRFEVAIGPDAEVFDFSSVALDGSGNAGFSNGHDFGPFTWTSLSLGSDIDLLGNGSISGTLWVTDNFAPPIQGSPGAAGASGSAEDNDDYRLDFSPTVRAAGLEMLGNRVDRGERIEFRDDTNQLIASFELPGLNTGSVGSDSGGFVGIEVCAGMPAIASVTVLEGNPDNTDNDDIGFTNVVYVPEPGAMWGFGAGIVMLGGLVRRGTASVSSNRRPTLPAA